MIGVLAAQADPERIGALVMVGTSAWYIDDGDYRGGFSAQDIDELAASPESNYWADALSWPRPSWATPDRPELGQEMTHSFCATDP